MTTTGKTKRILVIDDEQDVRAYLSRLLQEHGYAVTCAAGGNEAMRAVEKEAPDLITLDLSMPKMSGVRFYRDIKAAPSFKRIPVIFVTAVSGPGGNAADAKRFYSTRRQVPPPDGFIAKPIDPEETLDLIQKLLGMISS